MNSGCQVSRIVKVEVRDRYGNLKAVAEKTQPTLSLYKRVVVKDEAGEIKEDSGLQPAHSFTINFLKFLEAHWRMRSDSTDTGDYTWKPDVPAQDVTNTQRTIQTNSAYRDVSRYSHMLATAGDGDANYGIVLGTGVGAESNADYALGTKIASGTGSGQLDYGPQSFVTPYVNGSYIDFVLSRSFYNASGSPITVTEFGLYIKNGNYYFCWIRDLEANGKTVLAGDTMVVQYTIRCGAGWVLNFLYGLKSYMENITYNDKLSANGTTPDYVDDSDNATMTGIPCGYWGANNWNNDATRGLVVGSGNDAEAFTDYKLQTQIPNTTLTHLNENWTTAAVVGSNVDLIMSRSFYNPGASPATVTELAFYAGAGSNHTTGLGSAFCLIRDHLGAGVTIDPGDTGTVQYTWRTNVAD